MLSSAVLCFMLLYVLVLCHLPAAAGELPPSETQNITVKPGQDASLQCQTHTEDHIKLLEWSRADLRPDDYVFFFRENRPYENYQPPSYRGRVQLRDPKMEDGDFSVLLKNVSFNDTGTYRCRVAVRLGEEFIRTINLTVKDSGEPAADEGGAPDLVVVICGTLVAVLLLIVLVTGVKILISRRREAKSPSYGPPEPEPGGEEGEDAFNDAPVEGREMCGGGACFPRVRSTERVEPLLSFSEDC